MAFWLLQSPVLPDRHHAEHSQEERASAGQNVSGVRGHQEEQGGDGRGSEGGRLHTRPLHGGGEVGRQPGDHHGVQTEGALPPDAGHPREGGHPGQAGNEKLV